MSEVPVASAAPVAAAPAPMSEKALVKNILGLWRTRIQVEHTLVHLEERLKNVRDGRTLVCAIMERTGFIHNLDNVYERLYEYHTHLERERAVVDTIKQLEGELPVIKRGAFRTTSHIHLGRYNMKDFECAEFKRMRDSCTDPNVLLGCLNSCVYTGNAGFVMQVGETLSIRAQFKFDGPRKCRLAIILQSTEIGALDVQAEVGALCLHLPWRPPGRPAVIMAEEKKKASEGKEEKKKEEEEEEEEVPPTTEEEEEEAANEREEQAIKDWKGATEFTMISGFGLEDMVKLSYVIVNRFLAPITLAMITGDPTVPSSVTL